MDNKKLKRLMTDLAKGKVSQKEVDLLINPIKVENSSVKTAENHTQTRKTKSLGGKK